MLVRLDGVGDALMLAPLIAALRDAGHELGAVYRPGNADLYRTDIVRRHVLDEKRFARCAQELHACRYDVALLATEKPFAYRMARAARIPRRVGFWNGFAKPLKSLWIYPQLQRRVLRGTGDGSVHEVETLFSLGAGLHPEPLPTCDVKRLRPLFFTGDVAPRDEIVVQITAKWLKSMTKDELTARVRSLSEYAKKSSGLPTVAAAAPEELAFLREICEAADIPGTAFSETVNWLEKIAAARLLVTPDTGAAHAAGIFGTPVIDVFAADTPAARQARWRPWSAPQVLLRPPDISAKLEAALAELVQQTAQTS